MVETLDIAALSSGAATLGLDKELIVATGADRVRFLHGIVTADVAGTPVGDGCQAALLTAKAHVVAEMRIFVRESDLYLLVAAGQGEPTAAALSRYAIMDDFVAARRADIALLALLGADAGAKLSAVGYPSAESISGAWSHADADGPFGPLWLARVRHLGVDGFWIAGPPDNVAQLRASLDRMGVRRLAADVAEAARIAAGEPAWGSEITGDYFPMEVGLNAAIDYTKGCFLGQEPIVRIRDRGHINWRLVRVALDPDAAGDLAVLPAPGDRLETDAKPKAGRITSVARLHGGRGIGLALAHISVTAGQAIRVVDAAGAHVATATIVQETQEETQE
jgi:folate-binding protein YgfZ